MPVEAIGHALAAGDHGRVVELLEDSGWALLNQGYARTMGEWLDRLPEEWRGQSPRINLDFAWMHLLRGSLDQAWPRLAQAEAAFAYLDPASAPARGFQVECLALRACQPFAGAGARGGRRRYRQSKRGRGSRRMISV